MSGVVLGVHVPVLVVLGGGVEQVQVTHQGEVQLVGCQLDEGGQLDGLAQLSDSQAFNMKTK